MWFAAGTAAFMACLERSILVSFFGQWRVLVFLTLNLVFLAILFTSTRPISSNEAAQGSSVSVELEAERKKRRKQRRQSSLLVSAHDHHEDASADHRLKLLNCSSSNKLENLEGIENYGKNNNEADHHHHHELSKEELNERVEAFIAMFRQHLVSDAKGKSCMPYSSHTKTMR